MCGLIEHVPGVADVALPPVRGTAGLPGPPAGALGWAAADPATSVGGGQHVAGIGFIQIGRRVARRWSRQWIACFEVGPRRVAGRGTLE